MRVGSRRKGGRCMYFSMGRREGVKEVHVHWLAWISCTLWSTCTAHPQLAFPYYKQWWLKGISKHRAILMEGHRANIQSTQGRGVVPGPRHTVCLLSNIPLLCLLWLWAKEAFCCCCGFKKTWFSNNDFHLLTTLNLFMRSDPFIKSNFKIEN